MNIRGRSAGIPTGPGRSLSASPQARLALTYREFNPRIIQHSVGLLVMGIIPLDALLVLAGGPWWGGVLVLALLLPSRLFGRLVYVT